MKLIQVWMPDVSAPSFAAESIGEADDQAFIASITDASFSEWSSPEDEEAFANLQ